MQVRQSTSLYPSLSVDTTGGGVVSQAGAITLLHTAEKTGLTTGLSAALPPWRKPLATHDPGKILLDLAVAVALGGDCLADLAVLREGPGVFGSVASDPTVSRLFSSLAADALTAWPRSTPPAPPPARPRGRMQVSTPPITTSAPRLPGFLAENQGPVAFLHLAADLYSATKTVLELVGSRLVTGSVVLFDEYFNYPGWQDGEHRAWMEYVDKTRLSFHYAGYTYDHEQVIVVVDDHPGSAVTAL